MSTNQPTGQGVNEGAIIAIDFDGTCVHHEYPDVGREAPHCVFTLKKLNERGAKLILWTMRSGQALQDAVDWFEARDITLWGIQRNPEQDSWTDSPKAYAQIYIDDAAFGCPLRPTSGRPVVDWWVVERVLLGSTTILNVEVSAIEQ